MLPPSYGLQLIDAAAGARRDHSSTVVQRAVSDPSAASQSPTEVREIARIGTSGRGGSLPYLDAIQRSFGRHDVSKVVAHTDGQAAASARKLGALAYATGNHVAFAGTPSLHTAAHEAAHTIQQRAGVQLEDGIGEAGDVYERQADAVADLVVQGKSAEHLLDANSSGDSQAVQKQVQFGKKGGSGGGPVSSGITMKRKHIHLTGADKYGHWWTELGAAESYGWWPKYPVGLKETLLGTDGELNGVTSFGGTATQDPHHGDTAEESFVPNIKDPTKSPATVIAECRTFAKGYSGEWRWTLGWGQNCHTFQEKMMETVGLEKP